MKQQITWQERIKDLIRLVRVEDYGTSIQLVIGYVLAEGTDWVYLTCVLAILVPCVYGGLYAINDAHDAHADRWHPVKRTRPVAAGRIRPRTAYSLGIILICLGICLAVAFDPKVAVLSLLFICINIGYTFLFKFVPYLEIVMNTITHPLRFAAGLWLAGGRMEGLLLAAWLLAVFALATLKRVKEMREASLTARPVLRFYHENTLKKLIAACIGGLLGLLPFMHGIELVLTGIWLVISVATVIGFFRITAFKRMVDYMWR